MAGDIGRWLEELALGKYREIFDGNEIDLEILPRLTEEDLKELGLPMGPRKKILAAMRSLVSTAPPAEDSEDREAGAERPIVEAERRQLTVLFCDLVGSTLLSRRLDPEDLREVMRAYQDAVAGAVVRYDGHIAKYLGDGVLAYFGWPQAYEDQVQRALRAGLDAIAAVAGVKVDKGAELTARVGVATGQVVVGDLIDKRGRDVEAVSGETPNLAARLQQVAEPGQVVIDDQTRNLVGRAFRLESLDRQHLKGFDDVVRAWSVVGESQAEFRFAAAHVAPLTRLVGRESELALMHDRWKLAEGGEGQVVLISGEAGVGKSRLLGGLRDDVGDRAVVRIFYQCSPYHVNSALYPIIRQLESAAGILSHDDDDEKLDRLEALVNRSGGVQDGDLRLFAHLLSLPYGQRYGPLDLPPQQAKTHLLDALVRHLLRPADGTPVLILCEDVHWIDPTSTEMLNRVIARIGRAPALLMITHRPEWRLSATAHGHVTALHLNRLGRQQSAEIVRAIVTDDLPDGIVRSIVTRADGIPLFIEELANAYVGTERQAGDGDIPATLQASLLARIDRLGPLGKDIAQTAAVIGREFSRSLLAPVVDRSEADFDRGFAQLVESELVVRTGTSHKDRYQFKHSLLRDAAYDSLLRRRRQEVHVRIAKNLEQNLSASMGAEPELIAHHLVEGGKSADSIRYWIAAAEQALSRASYSEADTIVASGLAALQGEAETHEHSATTVDLLLLRYAARYPLGDPQALLAILSEAEAMVVKLNDEVRRSKVLTMQTYVLASNGRVDEAVAVGERNASGLERHGDANLFCHGNVLLARALYAAGQYAKSIAHATKAMERVGGDVELGRDLHGLSHSINSRAFIALCHAERGAFRDGLRVCEEAVRSLADLKGGAHEHLWTKNALGRLNLIAGDPRAAIEAVDPVLGHCRDHYPVYFPRVASSLGAAYVGLGEIEKGLTLLQEADDQLRSTGFRFGHALVLSQLAEALLIAGVETRARDQAKLAIETARNAGERGNEGWATCVLGDIDAKFGRLKDAAAHYRVALAIAGNLEMAPLMDKCQAGYAGLSRP